MSKWIAVDLSCPDEEGCGSSDAFALDKKGGGYCFSCHKQFNQDQLTAYVHQPVEKKPTIMTEFKIPSDAKAYNITDRGLRASTLEAFDVVIDKENHYYPYQDSTGETVSYKIRDVKNKKFTQRGRPNGTRIFGLKQAKKHPNKRFITIHEGELDSLSGMQMNNQSPHISVPSSSDAEQACKHHMQWLETYDHIKLSFDDDKQGRIAAKKVSKVFPIGKVSIVQMDASNGLKDASDYLRQGKIKEYQSAWWAAEPDIPSVIVNGDKLLETIKKKKEAPYTPYPWEGLNKLIYGIRDHQLVAVKAPPKVGKTNFSRALEHHFFVATMEKIGCMFLEESPDVSAEGLMSLHAGKAFHRPDTDYTEEEHTKAAKETLGTGRVYYYDHFGNVDLEEMLGHLRYMVVALGVKFVILDHISIMMPKGDEKDSRKLMEEAVTRIKQLLMELPFSMIIVSHVNDEGKFRDSRILQQIADVVIDLKRDVMHEDVEERNRTYVSVEADRWLGGTGPACVLQYDVASGRMTEYFEEEEVL